MDDTFQNPSLDPQDPKPWKCDLCEKTYKQRAGLEYHKKVHSGEIKYKCHVCEAIFHQKSDREAHVKTVHVEAKSYKCNSCDQTFHKISLLHEHKKMHLGQGQVVQKKSKSLKCSTCGAPFKKQLDLAIHMETHVSSKAFVCQVCNKTFGSNVKLKCHQRTHTGEKPFQCVTCGKSFSLKFTLENHKKIHTGEKPFKCQFCEKCFRQKCHLTSHTMKIHTPKDPANGAGGKIDDSSTSSSSMDYHNKGSVNGGGEVCMCQTCGLFFSGEAALNEHIASEHALDDYIKSHILEENPSEEISFMDETLSFNLPTMNGDVKNEVGLLDDDFAADSFELKLLTVDDDDEAPAGGSRVNSSDQKNVCVSTGSGKPHGLFEKAPSTEKYFKCDYCGNLFVRQKSYMEKKPFHNSACDNCLVEKDVCVIM